MNKTPLNVVRAGWRDSENFPKSKTIGWEPSCKCNCESVKPCLVLDPFAGSGTTLQVATELRRDYIGIELNPEYLKLIRERVEPAEEKRHQRELYDMMEELPQESD
jgi:SAM-dependent methyltransferase